MSQIPSKTQILVIGGGPGGSYAASCMAREGFEVTVFEADSFPRYHIGESFIPSMRTYLEFIDAFDKVNNFGFVAKPGGAFKFAHKKREAYTDFTRFSEKSPMTWHVTRADFDDILLKHARESGATVFEKTRVLEVKFQDDDVTKRPIAAVWKNETQTGTIAFDFVVDASGRAGVMATKHLKNRKINASLKNSAMWGYWHNCGRYGEGTNRRDAIWIETLQDGSGWVWIIPLHDGTTSVGFVQNEEEMIAKKKAFKAIPGNEDSTLYDFYINQFSLGPGTKKIMTDKATFVTVGKDGGAAVKQASDYSYSSTNYGGIGYRLVGDAGCFIDPYFSSGLHLAFTSALSASATIASTIRGVPEADTIKWHNTKVGVAYNRFLMLVLTTYKQIRNIDQDILSDFDQDNFDHAFDMIRPLIQGTHDVNKKVTENEIEDLMKFLAPIAAAPVNPLFEVDSYTAEAKLTQEKLDELLQSEEQKELVAANKRSWKALEGVMDAKGEFGSEALQGYTILMERGKLCMIPL